MKKRIVGILLAAIMIVGILPLGAISAFADGHVLSVSKNGEDAVYGTDYSWEGDMLIIKTGGLTISGKTSAEYIRVETSVETLTISDVEINCAPDAFVFLGNTELIAKGTNTITTSKGSTSAIYFSGSGKISGDGNLYLTGVSHGIHAFDTLTLAISGNVGIKGEYGIYAENIVLTNDVVYIVVYGENESSGAVAWYEGGNMNVAPELSVKGSEIFDCAPVSINKTTVYNSDYKTVKVDDSVAKSVKVVTRDFRVLKDGAYAEYGTDYVWDPYSSHNVRILKNGLTVTGLSKNAYIEVAEGVTDLTIEDLYIEDVYMPLIINSEATVILKGDNVIKADSTGIVFSFGGEITGDGSLYVSGVENAIVASHKLTISAEGKIIAESKGNAIYANEIGASIVIENTVKDVTLRGNNGTSGAVLWNRLYGDKLSLGEGVTLNASADYSATYTETTNLVTNDPSVGYVKVGDKPAKTLVFRNHDLVVTKNGKLAEDNVDYKWEDDKLIILDVDLTVSGTTDKETIGFDDEVTNVTFENLSLTYDKEFVISNEIEVSLKGNNVFNIDDQYGLVFESDCEINGDGNLTIEGCMSALYCKKNIDFASSGTLVLRGTVNGFTSDGKINFTNNVGKILIYGASSLDGAVALFENADVTASANVLIKGSAAENAEETQITNEVTLSTEKGYIEFKVGDEIAKSVLVKGIYPEDGHDLVVRTETASAVSGTDYSWEGNKLHIKKSGLTVVGSTDKDLIYVENGVENLTIKNLQIITFGEKDTAIYFAGDSELIIDGGCQIVSEDFTGGYGIYFCGKGKISGSGDLYVLAEEDALSAENDLTVSGTGVIKLYGKNGIFVEDGVLFFTDTVKDVRIYGARTDLGAAVSEGGINFDYHLAVKGSSNQNASLGDINGDAYFDESYDTIKVKGTPARSVRIIPHGIIITKNGNEAKYGEDYIWRYDNLVILKSGLTVSGKTEREFITVDYTVSDLTVEDLDETAPCDVIYFGGKSCELILKGDNFLYSSGDYDDYAAVLFECNGTISGSGNLTAKSANGYGVFVSGILTISASGTTIADGYNGIVGVAGIVVEDTVGKLLAYGYNGGYQLGAIAWDQSEYGCLSIPAGFSILGSADYQASESDIIYAVTYNEEDGCVMVGDKAAKSVILTSHDLSVTKNGSPAVLGRDYTWDKEDGNKLVIKAGGLTVSGKTEREYIYVTRYVNDLTIKDLSVSAFGYDVDVLYFASDDAKLTVKGDNFINDKADYGHGIAFNFIGEVSGDGNLNITCPNIAIVAYDALTMSTSGNVVLKGMCGILAYELFFTDDIGTVLAYSFNENYGAVAWECGITVDDYLTVFGAVDCDVDKSEIVKVATCISEDGCAKVGDDVAESVYIYRTGRYDGHYLHVTREGCDAIEGADYEWDKDDPNKLIIKNNDVSVSGKTDKEHIYVCENVKNLNLDNLSIDISGSDAITVASDYNTFSLHIWDDNTVIVDGEHNGIVFCGSANVQIDGYGMLTVTAGKNGIISENTVILPDFVDLRIEAGECGIFAKHGVYVYDLMNKLFISGGSDELGAVAWNDNGTVPIFGIVAYGSTDFAADEFGVTESVVNVEENGCLKCGDEVAKTVIFKYCSPDEGHELIVMRGLVPASSSDYEWDAADPNKLIIKESGLTVTGTTGWEYICVNDGVTDLTIRNLYSYLDNHDNVTFRGNAKLILEGENELETCLNTCSAVCFDGVGEIAGEGDILVHSDGTGVYSSGMLTISASGVFCVYSKGCAIFTADDVCVADTVRNMFLFAQSAGFGAIAAGGGDINLADVLTVKGSAEKLIDKADITEDAEIKNGLISVGGALALSVLIEHCHDISVTKEGVPAEDGIDYEWDGNKLVIKQNGLTVSGKTDREYVIVDFDVTDLTIDGLYICEYDNPAITFHGNGELIVKGDNHLIVADNFMASEFHYRDALIFRCNGVISGDGNLNVVGEAGGIHVYEKLVISNSGNIISKALGYGIVGGDVEFAGTVGKVLVYGADYVLGSVYSDTSDFTLADNLKIYGDDKFNVSEDNITSEAIFYEDDCCVTVDGKTANSVLIVKNEKLVLGDFDNDGEFTSADLIYACQLDAGIITEEAGNIKAIDVDGDGSFTSADLIFMCQYDAGIITVWPAESK